MALGTTQIQERYHKEQEPYPFAVLPCPSSAPLRERLPVLRAPLLLPHHRPRQHARRTRRPQVSRDPGKGTQNRET